MRVGAVRVVVNPASAGGRGRVAARRLVAALDEADVPRQVRYTEAPGHAARLAVEAAAEGAEPIMVVGGDGTVHEVAGGLLADPSVRPPPLAVFPVGTGNDFFRMVRPNGKGTGPDDAVALLKDGTVDRFDVGRVRWENGERVFVNLLGVGVDVEVLRRRAKYSRLRGLAQYLAAFLDAVVSFKPPELRIETGDPPESAEPSSESAESSSVGAEPSSESTESLSGRTTLLAVTVGPSIGGGFMINPGAAPADGRLDLCRVHALGWRQVAGLVPQVVRGRHAGSRHVTMRQIKSASIRAAGGEPFRFELDGELVPGTARELRVDVLPRALPVLVPRRG